MLVFALTISACKKDKKEDTPAPTKKELLSNSWKIVKIESPDGVDITNLNYDQIKCFKDNVFTMKSDSSYVIDEGAVVCANSYASTGTWSLIDNDSKIKFTPQSGGDALTITLIDVNATTLKVSYPFTDIILPGTYIVTLEKK